VRLSLARVFGGRFFKGSGTDVKIVYNFRQKLALFVQNTVSFCKNWIIPLAFLEKSNFFAENCRKL
jgi:hypothetical protein